MASKYLTMQFAVRPAVVGRLLADMYGVLSLLTLVPATVALSMGSVAGPVYLKVVAAAALLWLAGRLLPSPDRVQKNEALCMVALLFISSSLLLCLPMMAYGIPFIDAWFESVSGVTTTGLSTLSLEQASTAFLFGRAWIQWVGGIGVVVLALAIFVRPGVIAKSMGFSDREMDDVVGGTRAPAKRVVLIYLLITAIGICALYISGASARDAIIHCMTALSTGGFANYPDSLASISNPHLVMINLLCIAGAVSFHLYYRSIFSAGRGGLLDNQLYALLSLLVVGVCAVSLLLWLEGSSLAGRDVLTLVVSAQTTAGFSTIDIGKLPGSVIVVLCLLMAVGGGAGSTSGGIKVDRALLVLRGAKMSMLRIGLPDHVYVRGENGEDSAKMQEALTLVFWFMAALLSSWLVFLVYGYPPLASLFEVTSALATVGLSSGITSEELPTELKVLLCGNMILGRLEIIAVLVLLAPRTWVGRRRGPAGRKK